MCSLHFWVNAENIIENSCLKVACMVDFTALDFDWKRLKMQHKIYWKIKNDRITKSTNSLETLKVLGLRKMSKIWRILIWVISSTPPSMAAMLPSFSIVKIVTIEAYNNKWCYCLTSVRLNVCDSFCRQLRVGMYNLIALLSKIIVSGCNITPICADTILSSYYVSFLLWLDWSCYPLQL